MSIKALGLKAGMADDGMEKSAILAPVLAAVKPLLSRIGGGVMGAASKYAPRLGNAMMAGAPAKAEGLASRLSGPGFAHGDLAFKKTLGGLTNAMSNRQAQIGAGVLAAPVAAIGANHLMNPRPPEEEKYAAVLPAIGAAVGSGAKALSPALDASLGGGVASRAAAILENAKSKSLSQALANKALQGRNSQLGAGALGMAGGGLLAAHAGGFDTLPDDHMPILGGV